MASDPARALTDTAAEGGARVPGILLITAIFGVDQEMRELADAWASDGFIVSVPDIFWRQVLGPAAARESRERVLRCFRSMSKRPISPRRR